MTVQIDLQTFILGIWLGINAALAVMAQSWGVAVFHAALCIVWLIVLFVLSLARARIPSNLIKSITIHMPRT